MIRVVIRLAPAAVACAVLAGCSSSSDTRQEVPISTSDRAQEILGGSILLSDLRERREKEGQKAWSFRLRNTGREEVKVRAVPVFIAADGRELGGSAEAKTVVILPEKMEDLYFMAPTGEVARLVVRFERN